MVKCPTSLFPTSPQGSPTLIPDACRLVTGYVSSRNLKFCGLTMCTGLDSASRPTPHPSRMTKISAFFIVVPWVIFRFVSRFGHALAYFKGFTRISHGIRLLAWVVWVDYRAPVAV